MVIRRKKVEQNYKRCFKGQGGGRKNIEGVNNYVRGFGPEFGGRRCLKKIYTKDVINDQNSTLCFTILLGRVKARIVDTYSTIMKLM